MEATGCVCREREEKKMGSSSSPFSFTTPFSFHSPPLPCSPNPLAAGRTAEGQKQEEEERGKDTERQKERQGWGAWMYTNMPRGERADERWQPCWAQRSDRPGEVGHSFACLLFVCSFSSLVLPSHLPAALAAQSPLTHIMSRLDRDYCGSSSKQRMTKCWTLTCTYTNTISKSSLLVFSPTILLSSCRNTFSSFPLQSHISESSGRSAHAGKLSRTLAFYYSWPGAANVNSIKRSEQHL